MLNIPEEVKTLLLQDSVKKNMRIHFPNRENRDLTNADIVIDTAKFTESTSSDGQIKLGINEASMFEVDVYNVKKIKGCYIDVSLEIDISDLGDEFIEEYGDTSEDVAFTFYSIPYGQFIVYEYKQKAESLIASIVAYDALALKVLHVDKKQEILNCLTQNGYNKLKKVLYYATPPSEYNDTVISDWMTDATINRSIFDKTVCKVSAKYEDEKRGEKYHDSDFVIHQNFRYHVYAYYTKNVGRFERVEITFGSVSDSLKYILSYNVDLNDIHSAERQQDRTNFYASYSQYPFDSVMKSDTGLPGANIKFVYDDEFSWLLPEKIVYEKCLKWEIYTDYYHNYVDYDKYGEHTGGYTPTISYPDANSMAYNNFVLSNDFSVQPEINIISFKYKEVYSPSNFLINGFDMTVMINKIQSLDHIYYTDIIDAVAKITGSFCKINKQTKDLDFYQMLEKPVLYPSNDLYPSDTLFPYDFTQHTYYRGEFTECDYQDYLTKPIGRVELKDPAGEEYSAQVEDYNEYDYSTVTIDASDSSNTFFPCLCSGTYYSSTWRTVTNQALESVKGITFRPFNGEFTGLPYMESGDNIMVQTSKGFFVTYILRRTLSGVQTLRDNLEAQGEE